MDLLLISLIVGITAAIVEVDIYGIGQTQISRPIVVGPIMGLVLGDVQSGVMIGATLEMMYLGTIAVGASIPPNATAATAITTALVILADIDHEAAIALAIPIAALASMLQIGVWTLNSYLINRADKDLENMDDSNIEKYQYTGVFLFFLQGFLPAFLAVYLGQSAVANFVNLLEVDYPYIIDGFSLAGAVLPALGFAMLYIMMKDNFNIAFFIVGFIMSAFFGATIIAVTFIGIAIAIVNYKYDNMSVSTYDSEEDDF